MRKAIKRLPNIFYCTYILNPFKLLKRTVYYKLFIKQQVRDYTGSLYTEIFIVRVTYIYRQTD